MPGMSADAARRVVDELYAAVERRFSERVLEGEFMRQLRAGTLPIETFRVFFRSWGMFAIEINTLWGLAYQRYLPFFKQHPDLMAGIGDKIADEFIHPEPPGHALILFETAEALGIPRQEILTGRLEPEFRGMIDFARTIMYEGTMAEWFSRASLERAVGVWSAACYVALTEHYGLTPQQAVYFSKHEEADLAEHDEGVMAHGEFNRAALERMLETGYGWERPGYGMRYCAETFVDLWGMWLDQALAVAARRQATPA